MHLSCYLGTHDVKGTPKWILAFFHYWFVDLASSTFSEAAMSGVSSSSDTYFLLPIKAID